MNKEYFDLMDALSKKDIKAIRFLISSNVDLSQNDNYAIFFAADKGLNEILKLLLKQPNINPADGNNRAISFAYDFRDPKTVQILWNDHRVKETLEKDDPELYEILSLQDNIKNFK